MKRSSSSPVPILKDGKQLTAGDLKAGTFCTCSAVMKNGKISHFEVDTRNRKERRAKK